MINDEMKNLLAKAGLAEADIEKVNERYDYEKITEIIEASCNPKEAIENLHSFYPELEVEKLQEQLDFMQEQFEAAMTGELSEDKKIELTESELESICGGGFCDWWKKNWKKTLGIAAVVVGTVVMVAVPVVGLAVESLALAAGGAIGGAAVMGTGLTLLGDVFK